MSKGAPFDLNLVSGVTTTTFKLNILQQMENATKCAEDKWNQTKTIVSNTWEQSKVWISEKWNNFKGRFK